MLVNQYPIVGPHYKKSKFWNKIEDHFEVTMFQNLECPFNIMEKVNPIV